MNTSAPEVSVTHDAHVATLMLRRPPHNFVTVELLTAVADALHALDAHAPCRAVVLAAEGKSFCAGADLSKKTDPEGLYAQAFRIYSSRKPIVAAVHGAAVGAGLGLALAADFRIAGPAARFSANFTRLGFHPGFGTSFTLPRLVGTQHAARMFYSGERIDGARAVAIGLADELVAEGEVLPRAQALAAAIAESAPLAVQATRETLRMGLADQVATATLRELKMQQVHFATADFHEGVAAYAERRTPKFTGA